MRATLGWMLSLVVLAMAGCGQDLNTSNELIEGTELQALKDTPDESAAELDTTPGLDRENWPEMTILIPARQTESYPTYIHDTRRASTQARQQGAFPTAATALDDENDLGEFWEEAALDTLVSFGLIVTAPFEAITGRTPWQTERQPSFAYQRTPSEGRRPVTGRAPGTTVQQTEPTP